MAQHGTVTGKFVDALEAPQTGSVIFTAAPGWILSATEAKTIVPEQVVVALDGTGSLSQQLLATDDTTLNPSGWTWNALILIDGAPARSFSFSLPAGTTKDLTTLSPVNTSLGNAVVKGDAGPQGPAGATGATGPQGPQGNPTSIVAGTMVTVDNTNPAAPVVGIDQTALSTAYAPGGTAGNINQATAQGIALVQALIFGA